MTQIHARKSFWAIIAISCVIIWALENFSGHEAIPDYSQRIAAKLISWGFTLDGFSLPVEQNEIDKHIKLLGSAVSEERVQAAQWLAVRGIREAGPIIAFAMTDKSTIRPCQLAKSLGSLGDKRWTPLLIDATKHPSNIDLRVCATLALSELAPSDAVNALIDVYRRQAAPASAIIALGRIADTSALNFLQTVADSTEHEFERSLALRSIEQIEIMQRFDPVPSLIERVRRKSNNNSLDEWAVWKLADLEDMRGFEALTDTLLQLGDQKTDDQVILAAALLAHGEPGISALRDIAESESES
jgi:HEAT repeat protein